MLRVRVFSGRCLLGTDLAGSSDAYVVLEVGGIKKKTKVKRGTRNPDWLECKDLPLPAGRTGELLVTVKDHDLIGSDDVLGVTKIDIASIPPGEELVHIYQLEGGEAGENIATILSHVASSALKSAGPGGKPKKKEGEPAIRPKNRGSISLGLTVFESNPPPPTKKPKGPLPIAGQACYLTVIAEGAAQLNATDLGAKPKSDPYCQLTVQKKKLKTKACKKTLNPRWHQVLKLPVPDGKNDFLLVKVKDKDLIGKSDSLGEVKINLCKLVLGYEEIFTLRLQGGDIGENIKMAADQVTDDAGAAIVTTVATKKGGKLAGKAAAAATGKNKHSGHALAGARKNYGVVCLRLLLEPAS